MVVINGDLELEGFDSNKFSSKIVKPRDGRRPLLVGNSEPRKLLLSGIYVSPVIFQNG